jgi:hypothetical protein
MSDVFMTGCSLDCIREEIPEGAFIIIGAGQFGSRAVRLISQGSDAPIFVVDADMDRLSSLGSVRIKRISCDGVEFLIKNYRSMNPANTVVPAVPFHLAFEWLASYLKGDFEVKKISVPEEIRPLLPNTWPGSEGSLLVSYANFICPDDCPEPDSCTVTGERREEPLHRLLSRLSYPGFNVHIIRSRQIAAGLGGYRITDLTNAAEWFKRDGAGKWLLGTACKCHGILTAFENAQRAHSPQLAAGLASGY